MEVMLLPAMSQVPSFFKSALTWKLGLEIKNLPKSDFEPNLHVLVVDGITIFTVARRGWVRAGSIYVDSEGEARREQRAERRPRAGVRGYYQLKTDGYLYVA